MRVCLFDTETHPFGPGRVAPPILCIQWGWLDEETAFGLGNGERELMHAQLEALFQLGHIVAGVNIAYDLRVVCNEFPDLEPLVWEKLEQGEIVDIIMREKLLNLSTTGKLQWAELPDGNALRIGYGMDDLVLNHLGIDLSADKKDPSSPRYTFAMFDGQPFADYSPRHKTYALNDVHYPRRIWLAQDSAAKARGGQFVTQEFNTAAAFALFCMTERGAETDPEQFEKMVAMVQDALHPDKMKNLIEAGILREAVPPREWRGKMTKGKPESINEAILHANVERVCRIARVPVKRTPTGAVCCDQQVMEQIADYDEALQEYQARQVVGQIKKTEIPRMMWDYEDGQGLRLAPVVYFPYNALVETTRTSSMSTEGYPSSSGQNVDPRAKPVYRAREGWVFCGADFSTLELVTLGQTCYRLFGKSTHRDVILAGRDNHTYLAGPLARRLSPELRVALSGLSTDAMHDTLAPLKKAPEGSPDAKLFKLWRGLAKPVGLGNPGGMGPMTFLSTAKKKPYFVDVKAMAMELPQEFFDEIMDGPLSGSVCYHHHKITGKDDGDFAWFPLLKAIALALELRRVWFDIYPEMRTYFDYVLECLQDDHNAARDSEGKSIQLYAYETPLGALRRGCTFTSVANGLGLQSPGAEGAKAAVFRINRECRDKTRGSVLYGCRPILFVHDEIITEIPEDDLMHERAQRISELMVESMLLVCPDVPIKAEPVLMRSWNKDAAPRFDDKGRLTIWTPS